jgi:peptidoglycan/LPS O-acetylase OafA/YrhL
MKTLSRKFNRNIEMLRGFAALMVVFAHIIYHHKYFDSQYFPNSIQKFQPSGHFAVLIFFVLSGYVIGISHEKRLNLKMSMNYLKKRLIRIYPIYAVSIILVLLISKYNYGFSKIFANATLTQNIFQDVFWENNPAWSLNFEFIFYLVFIPISYFQFKSLPVLLLFLFFGILCTYFPLNPIFTAYFIGFSFWLCGLFIARNFDVSISKFRIIPFLFYILALGNILQYNNFFTKVLSIIRNPLIKIKSSWYQTIIGISDIIYLPFCFFLIIYFSQASFKFKKQIFLLLQLIPVYMIILFLKNDYNNSSVNIGILFYLIAIISNYIRVPEHILIEVGLWLGGISYSLYIVHFPLLCLFGRMEITNDNGLTYTIRVVIYLIILISISYFLEIKMQRAVKKLLLKPAKQ